MQIASQDVQPGDRIRLSEMITDPDPIPAGATGVVQIITPFNIEVKWDGPWTLHLAVPEDKFEVIERRARLTVV